MQSYILCEENYFCFLTSLNTSFHFLVNSSRKINAITNHKKSDYSTIHIFLKK